jgi:LPXTG-site transpeptidase (sortase) family protein
MNIFDRLWQATFAQKLGFLVVFFMIFTVTYAVLYALDWLPEKPSNTTSGTFVEVALANSDITIADPEPDVTPEPVTEFPTEIHIPALKKTVPVLNTQSRDYADLDADLLEGVVRHPDSAMLGEEGNVFILGHSSYLPNVLNKNFQAFNGLQNLDWGDTVVVRSETTEYVYMVKKVYQAKASAVTVPLDVQGNRLTLATCNSFGSVDDRHILEAELLEVRTLE